jgi:hypothetical protein
MRVAGLMVLSVVSLAWGQAADDKKDDKKDPAPAAASWTILFRYDDPSVWDRNAVNTKGEQIAIPLKFAPEKFSYLRLRRMDTGDTLILPITPDQLRNEKPAPDGVDFWWNGSAKEGWKGLHLGIVQGPRQKFPAPKGMISVMNEGWDSFYGSGFGHKVAKNDAQYYCWRGKEIPRCVFEIAVSEGPLSPEEKRCLVSRP